MQEIGTIIACLTKWKSYASKTKFTKTIRIRLKFEVLVY